MFGIIVWLIIIGVIVWANVTKGNRKTQRQAQRNREAAMHVMQQNMHPISQNNTYKEPPGTEYKKRVMTDADRAKLEAYRRQKVAGNEPVQKNLAANRQRVAAQPDIVQRAKENSARYQRDETLEALEREHRHPERSAPAVADYVEEERARHLKLHTEPVPQVEDVSLLGCIEDLMVKGYEGNLSFERDFVGEAMDLLNSFTTIR